MLSDNVIDLQDWFGRDAETIVEIGSGTGTSTAAMAPLEAETNIVAVELYRPGLAKLLGSVVRGDIDNVRMVRGDGVEVLQRMFAPGCGFSSRIRGRRRVTTSAALFNRARCTLLPRG